MVTLLDMLDDRDKQFPSDYTDIIKKNIEDTLIIANRMESAYGHPLVIKSGWRPPYINAMTAGAAFRSKHLLGLAFDAYDENSKLMNWILNNLELMKEMELFFEDFNWTATWCHIQVVRPISGRRIFIPNVSRPSCHRWPGQYDHGYDL